MVYESAIDGVVAERWDDTLRQYTDFRPNPDVVLTYAEKSIADGFASTFYDDVADARTAARVSDTNRTSIETKLNTAMGDIQALLDTTNPTINAGPAPYIKIVARAVRLLIRVALRRYDGDA